MFQALKRHFYYTGHQASAEDTPRQSSQQMPIHKRDMSDSHEEVTMPISVPACFKKSLNPKQFTKERLSHYIYNHNKNTSRSLEGSVIIPHLSYNLSLTSHLSK